MASIKNITDRDLAAFDLIKKCGFVSLDLDGNPHLETHEQITRQSFTRLLILKLIKPAGDAMFGVQSQTFKPSEDFCNE